ncbi:MAG TPA: methyltransferase domain-containing protein [Nocardioidaceae bacterium]|nr:methyltransferase domain-containing protein [Nocardioidaceae bacterium]
MVVARDAWERGGAYENFMGRWSRQASRAFLSWLDADAGGRWLDVGCGTGALTATAIEVANPSEIVGVDPSEGFIETARARIDDPRARFEPGDASGLRFADAQFDVVVGGLMLNFVPVPGTAAAEMARVAAPGGVVAAYVWDYAEGMAMLRHFWEAAVALDPEAETLDEGRRFPWCRPEPLRSLWAASLTDVSVRPIDVIMAFRDFDDYWTPFLGGQGPASAYVMALPDDHRSELRALLRDRLRAEADGSIVLAARAWAVRGTPGVRPTRPA